MPGLTAEQVERFRADGFLVVEGLISQTDVLDPLAREYDRVLDRLAQELHTAGCISDTYTDLAFSDRFIQIERETNETNAQYFDFSLPQGNIAVDTPMWLGPAVFEALVLAPLLDAVETIIGGEIYSNPVQHVRIKPPERLGARDEVTGRTKMGATNWHQDNGVVLPVADDSDILTVWFSLADARVEHGCLQVIPQSHRLGLLAHCPAGPGGLEIPETVAGRDHAVPLPTKRGDAIFLHKRTIHSSLSNVSDEIRWSFDLRYNPIGQETGRGSFPGFIARSRLRPETELRSRDEWAQLWQRARARLADVAYSEPFNRWSADAPVCA
ncbi:MAG: phytanoyl-CoA dioxygenase family protein [Ilumatobacteraceae bacterium]